MAFHQYAALDELSVIERGRTWSHNGDIYVTFPSSEQL